MAFRASTPVESTHPFPSIPLGAHQSVVTSPEAVGAPSDISINAGCRTSPEAVLMSAARSKSMPVSIPIWILVWFPMEAFFFHSSPALPFTWV